jgi:hypothetical protein
MGIWVVLGLAAYLGIGGYPGIAGITPSSAQLVKSGTLTDEAMGYIDSNTVAIFYHEMGHALIDLLDLPVYGQEEDAADVLSVVLIDEIFEKEDAELIAYDAALNMLLDAEWSQTDGESPPFWGVHGLSMQRFYTLVCLHYGASPETREAFRKDFELPDERAAGCPEERELADASWGPVLDEIEDPATGSGTLVFTRDHTPQTQAQGLMVEVLQDEIDHWNTFIRLPRPLSVSFGLCDEVNAFYIPAETKILMCAEYADYLETQIRE